MSCDPVKNPCPVSCPKVREQLRIAIKELPNVTDGIFPRKKNDIEPRLPTDVISRDIQDERAIETAYIDKVPIDKEFPIREPTVIPTEEIHRDEEKIDFVEEEELVEKPAIISKETVIPTEKIVARDEEKIDFVEEEELVEELAIIPKETVTPTEKIVDRDEEKLDLVTEEKLDQELVVEKEIVIPPERIIDRDDEKIVEEDLVVEEIAAEPVQEVPIEEPEIIEDKIKLPKIELEPSRELEERFEPEERMEYEEEEESITDYEKFIDEELQESLPAVIAKEIPEESRAVRHEISRNAATLYERIDRERPVRPPREREAVTAMPEERPAEEGVPARRALEDSTITEQISLKPAEDACEETCPLVKEQKERIMRKLKARQRVVDHYYLTKGFNYFEDVCTCSLACMVYTLSRDPFVKSIFASLALFAVGLKLCSELDAWEMPSRVS